MAYDDDSGESKHVVTLNGNKTSYVWLNLFLEISECSSVSEASWKWGPRSCSFIIWNKKNKNGSETACEECRITEFYFTGQEFTLFLLISEPTRYKLRGDEPHVPYKPAA